jgi:antirestriction protein ArdC
MTTQEEKVLFHELSHYVDNKLNGELKGGQDPTQEIVAELSAAALGFLVGKDGTKYLGNHYRYIESYAKEMKLTTHTACLKVLNRVEKIIKYIME